MKRNESVSSPAGERTEILDESSEIRNPVRILLVDDHAAMRSCLRALIDEHPDMTVVGEARDGEEALVLTGQLQPDVVLMDVQLPRLGGIEATRRLQALAHAPVVIGLTVHWTAALESDMWQAGGRGCLSKAEAVDRLHAVILAAHAGVGPALSRSRGNPRDGPPRFSGE